MTFHPSTPAVCARGARTFGPYILLTSALALSVFASSNLQAGPLDKAERALDDAIDDASEDRDCRRGVRDDLEDIKAAIKKARRSSDRLRKILRQLEDIEEEAEDCPRSVLKAISSAKSAIKDEVSDQEEPRLKRRRPEPNADDPDTLEKACDKRKAPACLRLAELYEEGQQIEMNHLRAAELYERACDLGSIAACNACGNIHTNDFAGTKRDDGVAFRYYQKSCHGGFPAGCFNLGYFYELGRGVNKNDAKALDLYNRACRRKDSNGCFSMGNAHHHGFADAVVDQAKAVFYWGTACTLGHGEACFKAAEAHEQGNGVEKSVFYSQSYYGEGCQRGHAPSCEKVDAGKALKAGVDSIAEGMKKLQNMNFSNF